MTYEQCFEECELSIQHYRLVKASDPWNYAEFQNIREVLSEALFYLHPHYADVRHHADQSEADRRVFVEQRSIHYRKQYREEPGMTAAMADSQAMVDAKPYFAVENDAKKEYYKVREMIYRVDQVLNSLASRIHMSQKDKYYDKEEN